MRLIEIIFFTFILFFLGCSGPKKNIFVEKKQENLVNSFNLKEFESFKEKKSHVAPKVTELKKETDQSSKPFVKKAKTPKKIPPSVVVKKEDKVVSDGYPKGYPDKLKDYDKSSFALWKSFQSNFGPGEDYILSLSYLGITAGHIRIQTKPFVEIAGKKAYHFFARLKSASFYSSIYSLDDTLESFISADEFKPIKYKLIQRESIQEVDDLQLFDYDKMQTYHWYKRIKRGKKKNVEKTEFIPRYFQDSFSSLFFVRGLPLNVGDKFEFPIVTRGKIWILKVFVAGEEKVEFQGNDVNSLKLVAETHFPGVLKKKGDITFWFSDDQYRRLLKFEAKVKIGALKGEMLEYKPGKI